MKKMFALILALVMVFSMAATAFAAEEKGSITVNGVSVGTTYKIYKLLDLESYEKGKAYSYKVNSNWTAFFATEAALNYVAIDDAGYVTWKAAEDDSTVAAFAKMALKYAVDHDIDPVDSFTATTGYGSTSYKFENLDLGWYLVDSTAGALCGLTTTDKDAVVNAKNKVPTVDKQVQEDLTGIWGDSNSADIGQIVNFMTVIHVAAGAENFVLHDKMSEGLTFVQNPSENRGVTEIKKVDGSGAETTLILGTDYTVKTSGVGDECTFEVVFDKNLVAGLLPNERLVVYYNAMLNRHAVAGNATGNFNEAFLEYGENHFSTSDKTTTYTFSFDIVKTDSSNQLISGAQFRIYDAAEGGNEVGVVPLLESDEVTPVLDANNNPVYRRARADEQAAGKTVPIDVKGGVATIVGFDYGTYYLEETTAPAGYNKLTGRKEFTISVDNLDAEFTDGIWSTGSGVHVVNKTGTMLPETGAMGTLMFISFGMFVALATGVLLITKKRTSMIED